LYLGPCPQALLAGVQLNFRRWLPPILFENWMNILEQVYGHDFDNAEDVITWKWCKTGTFSSKSMYIHLTSMDVGQKFSHIWKAKIPYKIKIFCWLVEKGAILIRDNLTRWNWTSDLTCSFCHEPEYIKHLFFQCPVAKVIWGIVGLCLGVTNIPRDISQYRAEASPHK
jgi:hypothetical protein